jgi:hypothetical protein
MEFKLHNKFRFDRTLRFDNAFDKRMYDEIRSKTLHEGRLSRKDFLRLAKWKSRRLVGHAEKNTEKEINEITHVALSAHTERCRITSLRGLAGVDWPMASVILHFCHRDSYPILDVRALGVLGCRNKPTYNFDFWWEYVKACRNIAEKLKTDMRTLDCNLFDYSRKTGLIAKVD